MFYAITDAIEPVELAEAKAHLYVTHNADDAMIEALIASARETVERHTGLALVDADYAWTQESAEVPLRPSEVTYTDGVATGFTTTAAPLPPGLRAAILLIVGDLYALRESNVQGAIEPNPTVQMLMFPHRINLGV